MASDSANGALCFALPNLLPFFKFFWTGGSTGSAKFSGEIFDELELELDDEDEFDDDELDPSPELS